MNSEQEIKIQNETSVNMDRVTNIEMFIQDLTCRSCRALLSLEGSMICSSSECGEQFCSSCIEVQLGQGCCFSCSNSFKPYPLSKAFTKTLKRLNIRCQYDDCGESLNYGDLKNREKICFYQRKLCT